MAIGQRSTALIYGHRSLGLAEMDAGMMATNTLPSFLLVFQCQVLHPTCGNHGNKSAPVVPDFIFVSPIHM